MTDAETAWLAGLFEGEGCLSTTSRGQWYLRIGMTDADVVERAAALAGIGNVVVRSRPDAPAHWKPQTLWSCYRQDEIEALVRQLRPWLGARRGARVDEFLASR